MLIDFDEIRRALSQIERSAAATATGTDRPSPEHIFAPEQHIGALDPSTTIVLGSRGTGKSFWAGVLAHPETRDVADVAYPQLHLSDIRVESGFTGQDNDGSVSRATIDAQVGLDEESGRARLLWRCVILRSVRRIIDPERQPERIGSLMQEFADPEAWEEEMVRADMILQLRGIRAIVIFDALDSLAVEWNRLRALLDALLEVAWTIRGFRSVRAKLFLRPDQIADIGLRFVELSKMLAGATTLNWSATNLYGMLFSRLSMESRARNTAAWSTLLESLSVSRAPSAAGEMRRWELAHDRNLQQKVFSSLAGPFMGRSNKKGRTYDWPINHLSDGLGEVTPRSFLTLVRAAAASTPFLQNQAINAEGIRNGLREASKIRLEQLDTEFKWIKRVLAPLARLQVPCAAEQILARWKESETLEAVKRRVAQREFLSPFDGAEQNADGIRLISRMVRMGILTRRQDSRYDMPDLFRVAARLLKKGGVAPDLTGNP